VGKEKEELMPLVLPPLTRDVEKELINSPKYRHLVISEYRPWRLYLTEDQRYLGRCYAWLADRHVDLHQYEHLTADERENLDDIMSKHSYAVRRLWGATLVNSAWLGNEIETHRGHAHMHLIPRYFATPEFCGKAFPDQRFGKNYAPYEKYVPSHDILMAIRDVLRTEIGYAPRS
jgi:diadenosine tetraphosphate (Ap4A) HIT family hydrolase